MIPRITYCIPSKNNLEYLKLCIPSIRDNAHRFDHVISVFVDADDEERSTVKWLRENKEKYDLDIHINPFLGSKLFGIGKAYDYLIYNSETEIFSIFHADMVLGKDADLKAFEQLETGKVVCSTRVEPPLHPNAGEKIIRAFGIWPEEFVEKGFNAFVENSLNDTRVTNGVFAPWMMYKDDYRKIGGHDPALKSAREDSDVFNRLSLAGFEFRQVWSSLVYHFTGRGGQFQHGSVQGEKDREWQKLMNNSTREFIRKWGTGVKHTAMMEPIISPRLDTSIVLENGTPDLLEALEPWCDRIYVDSHLIGPYIEKEQENTDSQLLYRVLDKEEDLEIGDVVYRLDGNTFSGQDFAILNQLPDIIHTQGSSGSKFKVQNFIIEVRQIVDSKKDLIYIKNLFD